MIILKYVWVVILVIWFITVVLDFVANYIIAKHADVKYKLVYSFSHLEFTSTLFISLSITFLFIYSILLFLG